MEITQRPRRGQMILVLMDVSYSTPKGCQRRQIYVIPSGFEDTFAILESCHPFGIGSMAITHFGFIARLIS